MKSSESQEARGFLLFIFLIILSQKNIKIWRKKKFLWSLISHDYLADSNNIPRMIDDLICYHRWWKCNYRLKDLQILSII